MYALRVLVFFFGGKKLGVFTQAREPDAVKGGLIASFMQSPAVSVLRNGCENFSFKLPVIKSVTFQVDFRLINRKVNSKKKTRYYAYYL